MANVDDDFVSNESDNESFATVIEARLSRRSVVGGGLATAAIAGASGIGSLLKAVPAEAHGFHRPLLGFKGIPVSSADTVVVPGGYTAKVLIAWGDPVSDGPAFKPDAGNSSYEQEWQWGMHNDGVVYFPIRGSERGLLVQNHEYTDDVLLFPDGTANWDAEKTRKSQAAHGVGIIEISRGHRGAVTTTTLSLRSIGAMMTTETMTGTTADAASGVSSVRRLMRDGSPRTRRCGSVAPPRAMRGS